MERSADVYMERNPVVEDNDASLMWDVRPSSETEVMARVEKGLELGLGLGLGLEEASY